MVQADGGGVILPQGTHSTVSAITVGFYLILATPFPIRTPAIHVAHEGIIISKKVHNSPFYSLAHWKLLESFLHKVAWDQGFLRRKYVGGLLWVNKLHLFLV